MQTPQAEPSAKSLASKRKDADKPIPGLKRGRGTAISDDAIVVVLETENKKRVGTKAHTQYQVILDTAKQLGDDCTVSEIRNRWPAGSKATVQDELRYCINKGWVEIKDAA